MPNPFMRIGVPSESKNAPERPQAMEPIPESYEGDNNPYRGTESHGVPQAYKPEALAEWDDTVPAYYEIQEEPADPIPVRIVEKSRNELRKFITRSYVIGVNTVQIATRNPNRSKITVMVPSTNASVVYIGNNESLQAFTGYPLGQTVGGLKETITSEDAIYAVAGAPNMVVYILEEYTVSE